MDAIFVMKKNINQPHSHTPWKELIFISLYLGVLGYTFLGEEVVILLAWDFCSQEGKRFASCSFVFVDDLEGKKGRAYDNTRQSDQRIKQALLCNLWAWSNLLIVPTVYSIVELVD